MSFSAPGGDGTVRGRFELSAEQPIRQLHSIRDAGAEADSSLRALGGTMDRLPARAAASWGSMHQVINREAGNISRRIDELEVKMDRFARKSATAKLELSGVARANAELSELEARLDRFSHKRAMAHAGVSGGGGFSNIAGGGGGGGGGGLFSSLGGIPGKLPWWSALIPFAPSLLGGAGALVGSAGSAALGAGAVGVAGAGVGLAGGIPSALIGRSAVKDLQGVTKAQTAYNTALQEFGVRSSQAQTAKRKLDQVMAQAPPGAAGAARQVSLLQSQGKAALAPAYQAVYGGIAQGAFDIRHALPGLAPLATGATQATANSAAAFVGTATNTTSIRQYGQLVSEFRQDLPFVEQSLANMFRTFLNLATAGRPFFHEAVLWVDHWTTGLRESTSDQVRVQQRMQGMVNSARDWARLLGAGGRVLRDIFTQGVPAGDSMVVQLTHTLDRWDTWLRDNPQKVRGFFSQAGRDVSGIAGAVASIAKDLWQVLSALHPIISGFSTLAGLVGGLGPGGIAGVGALLYGGVNALRSRGVAAPGVGSMAGSLVLGSGAPMVRSSRAAAARMSGGVVVPGAGEVSVTGPDGGTYLMPRSGFQTQVPRSAVGDQLPLFAAGAAGYAVRGARAAPLLSRGQIAFEQAYGGTAAETRFALPELVGQRAYGLSRLAAARPVLAGAARFAAPIIGITALLQGIQAASQAGGGVTHGIGAGVSAGASALTLGMVHPETFQRIFHGAFGTDNAGASFGGQGGRLNQIGAQAAAVQTPAQLHALERTVKANIPVSFEMSPGDARKFKSTLQGMLTAASQSAGNTAATQWTDALARGINRTGPERAVKTALRGVNAEIRGLGPTGARQWAQDIGQWAHEQEMDNPRLRKPMQRLMTQIVEDVNRAKGTIHGHFKDIRDSVYYFNGQILDGSTKTWQAIGGALTDPSQVAMEKLSGIWGQIQSEAIDALTSMGYTKAQARGLVTGLSHGTIKPGDVSSTGAAAASGLSPSHLTSVANRNQQGQHARGGVIGGQGLLDTVTMPDGSMAAPGEAYIANRHTMQELDLAALARYGKTAWQMIRDEDRAHSAPASATVRNRALNYNRHAFGGNTGQHNRAPSNAALNAGGASPNTGGGAGYVYPFPGLSPGRLDQGYDLSGAGPLYALGSGTVIESGLWHGWPGTGGVVYRLDSGPNAGQNVYYMEHVQSQVSVGQHVNAGQPIATLLSGFPFLEAGWANAAGTGPLTPYNGAADGTPMPGGINFRNFVNALLSGGQLPPGISGGGGVGAPTPISIRAPRTGLGGIPGALGDRASQMMTKGLQDKVNAKIGAMGGGGGVMGPGGGSQVTASTFGGPGDPGTGSTGYRGDNLYQHPDSFAELDMGTALGGLPYMGGIRVTHGGRSKMLYKRDIGLGGAGINGTKRAIDVWFQSAADLGINGLDLVQWQRAQRGGRVGWGGWNARGGKFVTQGPTMFGAGEKGKEQVSITPVGRGGAGGRQIVVNITGPISFSGTPQELDATARYVAGRILDALDGVGESGTHDAKLMGATS